MKLDPRLAVTIALGLALSAPAASQDQTVVDWIRANAVPLGTATPGGDRADMQPLKKLIGNARIVSLGEATHGSREFFQLKHRILEFLASELNFTIFAIEANMPEAYRLNDYVLNGAGDPAQLLKGMYFWTWDTEEVLAMIRWMREFNRSGKGRIEFTGFDMQFSEVSLDIVSRFVARRDEAYLATVRDAASMLAADAMPVDAGGFGVATASFPVPIAAGKRIRYSGYIKTESVENGWAGLWWRVDGASAPIAFDNMNDRGPRGTSDWKQFVIELPVAKDAKNINFGAILPGTGTAWFDDLAVEVDGQPYGDSSLFDFGFESPSPRGFFVGGPGYRVELDDRVVRTGSQSLRMTRVAPVSDRSTTHNRSLSRWQEIVGHLEAGRDRYRTAGAESRDIEWAIQNARLVVQRAQMFLNLVGRDRSMADNVKWIADQNPRAKIVLWAHNGHVAMGGGFAGESMGAALQRMFGGEVFVFGFAFGSGSFQAVPTGQGVPRPMTVPPAPEGSLDRTLSAADIPLFALDLRRAHAWFGAPRASRQIGAVYPEGEPYALMPQFVAPEAFHAILFTDKTTTAIKNPGR